MQQKIILNITHLLELDKWFLNLTEEQKINLDTQYQHAGNYLGLALKNQENINQETEDFEFEIFDQEKWNKAKQTHSFLTKL